MCAELGGLGGWADMCAGLGALLWEGAPPLLTFRLPPPLSAPPSCPSCPIPPASPARPPPLLTPFLTPFSTPSLPMFLPILQNRRGVNKVQVSYYSPPEETMIMQNVLMCRWMMKTENAVECGESVF